MGTSMSRHYKYYKTGRNLPCPCGSGKKYKKCCLHQSESFIHEFKQQQGDKEIAVIRAEEAGMIKMSEVILEYAGELLDLATTKAEKERAISIAIVAWNLALVDEEACEQQITNFLSMMKIPKNTDDWQDMENILRALIYKKQMEYPLLNRFIIDYQFIDSKNNYRLNIISQLATD